MCVSILVCIAAMTRRVLKRRTLSQSVSNKNRKPMQAVLLKTDDTFAKRRVRHVWVCSSELTKWMPSTCCRVIWVHSLTDRQAVLYTNYADSYCKFSFSCKLPSDVKECRKNTTMNVRETSWRSFWTKPAAMVAMDLAIKRGMRFQMDWTLEIVSFRLKFQ